MHIRVAVFGLQSSNISIQHLEEVSNYHIGHIRILPELHDALIPRRGQKSLFSTTRNLIKALLAKRIDLAITSPSMLPSISEELLIQPSDFKILYEYPTQPVSMVWTPETKNKHLPEIISRFDLALNTLNANGTTRNIIARYVDLNYFGP